MIIMGIDVGFTNMGCAVYDTLTRELYLDAAVTSSSIRRPSKIKVKGQKRKLVRDDTVSVVSDRARRCRKLLEYLTRWYGKFPTAELLVAEMPPGGSQNSVSAYTLGMASALIVAFEVFEFYGTLIGMNPGACQTTFLGRHNSNPKVTHHAVIHRFGQQAETRLAGLPTALHREAACDAAQCVAAFMMNPNKGTVLSIADDNKPFVMPTFSDVWERL